MTGASAEWVRNKFANRAPGRYYSTCPECSQTRTKSNAECLGVTVNADGSIRYGCNHCPFHGGVGNGRDQDELPTFYYPDSDGAPWLRKVRNAPGRDPKCFWQHWDGKRWARTAGGREASLLYLPDRVLAAEAKAKAENKPFRLVLAEGEGDVELLWDLGIPATCSSHGAAPTHDKTGNLIVPYRSKWTKAHSKLLRGLDLVVLGDNDPQGEAHADATCKCSLGIAHSVRRLDFKPHFPDMEKGEDVRDLYRKGKLTRERLLELLDAAPEYEGGSMSNAASSGNGHATDSPEQALLDEMNKQNCVVLEGGKARVLRFEAATHWSRGKLYSREVPTYLRAEDFKLLYLNRHIQLGDRAVDAGRWWLGHFKRRQYAGVTFVPGGAEVVEGKLNLWRGWGITPKLGEWSLMREHIFEVLADRDDAADAYIMNWLTWTVQNPADRAEVALVFKGKRGSGKGTLGNALMRIFGQHAHHVSSSTQLAGRFNGHMRDCCYLFADEAYWPGDKNAEGTLKRLITEPDLSVEAKGRDAVTVPNMLHVLMAANEDWVVPAGEKERRFAVFDVNNDRCQDAAHFDPLYEQLEGGGYAAMLYDLLHRDVGSWHPRRDVPRNDALVEQQAESLSPLDAWWVELLEVGELPGANKQEPHRAVSSEYEVRIRTGSSFDTRLVKRRGLYDHARQASPKLRHANDHTLGRYLARQGCNNTRKVRRRRGWSFPPLPECRARWRERFPSWQWRDPLATAWTCDADDVEPELDLPERGTGMG
jgi:hypothetical protein